MGKNRIFSLITMSQERALQDSNKTNMVSSTIFYSKEKKKAKNIFITISSDLTSSFSFN